MKACRYNLPLLFLSVFLIAPSFTHASFAPSDISGLKLWLKADSLSLNDGDSVATWTDSSGQGNNATQGTGSAQPIYKTNILNGQPVVRFDGSDNLASTFGSTAMQPDTIIVVAKANSRQGTYQAFVDGISTSARQFLGYDSAGFRVAYAGSVIKPNNTQDDYTWNVTSFLFNGASSMGWIDGIGQAGWSANPGSWNIDGITVGDAFDNSAPLSGDVAEVLVYNSALSNTDRSHVQDYLAGKYGISIPDSTAPSISLTSPTTGSTVSGTSVALTATASDNIGVSGVQFKLDTNTLIGSEDTSFPYTGTWDTAGFSGSHTISAVARDAAGNYATSTITVTVSNGGSVLANLSPDPMIYFYNGISTTTPPSSTPPAQYTPAPSVEPPAPTPSVTLPPQSFTPPPPTYISQAFSFPTFTQSLSFQSTGNAVKLLQMYLNENGFTVATSGAGSKGHETTYFGLATRAALIRFQKINGISPAVGYFGPVTRAYVNGGLR